MSYKPKYCCECGDKIERATWSWRTSRRFCELCATNFTSVDLMPKLIVGAALFAMIISVGSLLRKPEKNLVVSSNSSSNSSLNLNQNPARQPSNAPQNANSTIVQSPNNNPAAQSKAATLAAIKPAEKTRPAENQTNPAPEEATYFCGAQTKKGTPCTRRVKGGGRCWQHAGQPAMLPQAKLIAN